jgi:hypothetical protein
VPPSAHLHPPQASVSPEPAPIRRVSSRWLPDRLIIGSSIPRRLPYPRPITKPWLEFGGYDQLLSSAKSSWVRPRSGHGMVGLNPSTGERLQKGTVPSDINTQIDGDRLMQPVVCRGQPSDDGR